MKQRVQWIDTTKGIGMLLVILGHFMNDNTLVNAIYIFHIPLFFIISGYLFSVNKDNKTFLESKLRGLVLPYFSLGIPIIAAQMIFGKEEFLQDGVINYIVQQKYTTMWFLACLVIVNILAFILLKISSKNRVILILAFLLYLGGYVFTYILGKEANLPWNINTACVACLYFMVGYVLKKINFISKVIAYGRGLGICIFIIGIILGEFALRLTGRYDMFYNQYGLFGVSVVAALFCTIGLINLVQNKHIPIIGYIGRNSMIYFAFHQMIFKQIFKILFPSWNLFCQMISMVLTVICITIICECINRTFLRYCIGKR